MAERGGQVEDAEILAGILLMQNQATIAMCNRVGEEGDVTFAGRSVVVDSYGNVISEADGQERLIIADIDLSDRGGPQAASVPGAETARVVCSDAD